MQSQSRFCSYRYDALDRLAARSFGQSTMRRFYCADRLSTESEEDHHRSCLRAGGRLLAHQHRTADSSRNTLLATDEANSVLVTGSDLLTTITYSPYGHRENAALPPGVPGFNGEQPDPLTGHYLLGNGYRAFNPVLMRFNSPDSLSPFGRGGLNAYVYCAGDPVNRFDPTGHWAWMIGLGFAGAAMAGAAHFALKEINPQISQVLGGLALGLAIASAGFATMAGFEKVAGQLYRRLHVPMTSDGRRYSFLQRSAAQPTQPTQLSNLSRQEQAIRDVTRNTKGNQLLRFMELDEGLKRQVPRHLRTEAVSGRADMLSGESIYRLRRIALGEERGYLPSQVLDYENLKLMAQELPVGGIYEVERTRQLEYFRAMLRLGRV